MTDTWFVCSACNRVSPTAVSVAPCAKNCRREVSRLCIRRRPLSSLRDPRREQLYCRSTETREFVGYIRGRRSASAINSNTQSYESTKQTNLHLHGHSRSAIGIASARGERQDQCRCNWLRR